MDTLQWIFTKKNGLICTYYKGIVVYTNIVLYLLVTRGQRVCDRPGDAFSHVDEQRFDNGAHKWRKNFSNDQYQMDDRQFPAVAVFLVRRLSGHPVQRKSFAECRLDLPHVNRRQC